MLNSQHGFRKNATWSVAYVIPSRACPHPRLSSMRILRHARRSRCTFSPNHHNARLQEHSWFLPIYRYMVRMVRCRVWVFMVRISLTCRDCRYQALPNKADGFAVKAILAHDAITHPDHPLRIAGKPGIELYIGELAIHHCLLLLSDQSHFPFRYFGRWRGAPDVLLGACRICPLLVACNGPHKGAYPPPLF